LKNSKERVTWSCNSTANFPTGDISFIDITASSTRREDLLLEKNFLNKIWILRKYLTDMNSIEAMEFLRERLAKTDSNEEFLISMNGE
jgi:transcription termination factor Rho